MCLSLFSISPSSLLFLISFISFLYPLLFMLSMKFSSLFSSSPVFSFLLSDYYGWNGAHPLSSSSTSPRVAPASLLSLLTSPNFLESLLRHQTHDHRGKVRSLSLSPVTVWFDLFFFLSRLYLFLCYFVSFSPHLSLSCSFFLQSNLSLFFFSSMSLVRSPLFFLSFPSLFRLCLSFLTLLLLFFSG